LSTSAVGDIGDDGFGGAAILGRTRMRHPARLCWRPQCTCAPRSCLQRSAIARPMPLLPPSQAQSPPCSCSTRNDASRAVADLFHLSVPSGSSPVRPQFLCETHPITIAVSALSWRRGQRIRHGQISTGNSRWKTDVLVRVWLATSRWRSLYFQGFRPRSLRNSGKQGVRNLPVYRRQF